MRLRICLLGNGVGIVWQQKSKDNVHKHQEDDQRERPTVQVDFGHAECGEVLIAVDYWTKTCMAEVMSKNLAARRVLMQLEKVWQTSLVS